MIMMNFILNGINSLGGGGEVGSHCPELHMSRHVVLRLCMQKLVCTCSRSSSCCLTITNSLLIPSSSSHRELSMSDLYVCEREQ